MPRRGEGGAKGEIVAGQEAHTLFVDRSVAWKEAAPTHRGDPIPSGLVAVPTSL